MGYIIVTDWVKNDGSEDVSDAIQKIIDENPNRTIYFPDGTYLLSKPICTPAEPKKSVDLRLSNYAVLKASEDWSSEEAMVRLGGIYPFNDIRTNGSNYAFTGGIVDGSGIASGISIDSGRETKITDVSIKHTKIGIHIKYGANSGSSDADILNVNIIGNKATDSKGVLLEGHDNTLSNMRIADVQIGIHIKSCGNSMRNLHPLYTCTYVDYANSCGFYDEAGSNWYNFCYSDHFGIAFRIGKKIGLNIYDSCFCMWYSHGDYTQMAIRADGTFDHIVKDLKIGFHADSERNVVLSVDEEGGNGCLDRLFISNETLLDEVYKAYLKNGCFKW